ncbi:flagellin [Mesoterricola silvestris]|uniref:Flagellin n=1 Tax=Mesoterricola silvestris TaxID=2927979 RepID=A0AA48KAE6_9BACT|nr:flagellin [Mesoterricola silvestris]BDU74974.1 flagellin [Mesoterricola silvestris]
MTSILNNVAAMNASRQLGITGSNLQQTIERLTTGKRINKASDDAAGLAIGNKLSADIKIATQAQRNANDGVSYLQVADGALDSVTQLLTRASQLAQQAQTGTISDSNRANLDAEFQNIIKTMSNIGTNTKFNGQAIFSSTATPTTVSVQAGDYGSLTVSLGAVSTATDSALGLVASTDSLTSSTNAGNVVTKLASALESVSSMRASIGANEAQLSATSDILGVQVQNFTAASSQIMDANIADEVVNLTKFQILNQSGTSALAKSNQSSQQILALLQ